MASSSTGPSGGIEATLKVPREDLGYDAMMALVQEVQAAIASSAAGTLNGLREDLELVLANPRHDQLRSGADMLRLRLMNCTSGRQSISELREAMLSSCQQYMSRAAQGNDSTVNYVLPFIRDTSVVIAHGCGALLAHCVASSISLRTGVRFLVTEGLPGDTGRLLEDRVRTQPAIAKMEERMGREAFDALFARSFAIVPDSSVATLMEHADLVLCGAHAVTEHGGLVHTTGSLQLGMITNAMSVPFYVLCEEFKFSSIFPLSTPDLYRDASKNGRLRSALSATSLPDVVTPTAQTPSEQASSPTKQFGRLFGRPQSFGSLSTLDATAVSEAGGKAPVVLWPVELVPPKLVTFIFSEDGIMPPSAVADQMLQARRAAATGVRE